MAWFKYDQNNTGGSFVVDKDVCHRLFIEAPSVEISDAISETKGVYFDGVQSGVDCPCCGDRWSSPYIETKFPLEYGDGTIFESPEEYAQYLADRYSLTEPDSRIFYANGNVIEINKKAENK